MGDATCPRSNSIVLSTWARLASCGHGNVSICYTACVCCMSHQQEQANCREKRPLAHSISTLHPIRSLKHALSLLSGKTHHLQCKTGHIGQTCPTLALLFYCLIAYCNKGLYLLRQSRRSVFRRQGATQTPSTVTPIPVSGGHQPDWAICTGVCVFTLSHNTHGQCAPHTERDLHNRC